MAAGACLACIHDSSLEMHEMILTLQTGSITQATGVAIKLSHSSHVASHLSRIGTSSLSTATTRNIPPCLTPSDF